MKRQEYIKQDWKKTKVWFAILVGVCFFFNARYGNKIGLRENVVEYISGGIYITYILRFIEFVYKLK